MPEGLKTLVEKAMAGTEEVKPVTVSGEAMAALSQCVREWSGWRNARLLNQKPPRLSPFAACEMTTRTFYANMDLLLLNPNRVLLTVTPFRLRQEAILTGALLHEAAHARHSKWMTSGQEPLHKDGTPATRQAVALATLLEEPRIEGIMMHESEHVGAAGLGWTMRASAAQLVPPTKVSMDPDQAVMDFIHSWTLRAGRQIAIQNAEPNYRLPAWVGDFNSTLHAVLLAHITEQANEDCLDPAADTLTVLQLLTSMIICADDTGTTMLDLAQQVLDILFPETDGDGEGAPMAMPVHGMPGEDQQDGGSEGEPESDEEQGEGASPSTGDDQPEQESGESDEQESDGGQGQDEPESPGDGGGEGGGEGESDKSEDDEQESEESGQGGGGDDQPSEDESGEDEGSQPAPTESPLQQALSQMEARAASATDAEAEAESDSQPPLQEGAKGAGEGGNGEGGAGWRKPNKDEREIQKGAEKFLRDLIAPSETAKITLSESPSATVDGAALSAWKAGGQVRDPRFFIRTRREVEPAPPVKIAVLVDVSGSMDELQKPSAILSWSLAAAALDLRNFAGRGQQMESCLIHWGSHARVTQPVGATLPGIREVPCLEGTNALADAMLLVEEQMPGFFDLPEKPVNRLLVLFTDWELSWGNRQQAHTLVQKALTNGVNMVSIAPSDYSPRRSDLPDIIRGLRQQRGISSLLKYNKMFPERVWDQAAEALESITSDAPPAPFPGF
jgi:hypothetical protein